MSTNLTVGDSSGESIGGALGEAQPIHEGSSLENKSSLMLGRVRSRYSLSRFLINPRCS